MKNSLVTVVIVTFNRRNELKKAIQSVITQEYSNIEIILVNNHSTDDTVEMVKNSFETVRLINMDKNYGCPQARNTGIRASKGDIVFLLDDDAWIDSNLIGAIIGKFGESPSDVGVIVPQRIDYTSDLSLNYFEIQEEREIYRFTGCGVAIKKEIFENVGYFPDTHYGSEESYLAIKMYNKGYKIIFTPNLYVHHRPSYVRNNQKYYFLRARNDMIWVWTFSPRTLLIPLFLWKTKSWLRKGIKIGHLFSVIKGLLTGIFVYGMKRQKDRVHISTSIFIQFLINRKKTSRISAN